MLVYILPFFVNEQLHGHDYCMAKDCLESLSQNEDVQIVIYNQGCMKTEEIDKLMGKYNIKYHVIGEGTNIGIPAARYCCLNYIWDNIPETEYIAEVHLDMVFTKDWHKPLIQYLKESGEPLVAPRILFIEELTRKYKVLGNDSDIEFPNNLGERLDILNAFKEDKIVEGFVHPIIHNAKILKEIHPYDVKFLIGKQGFEDDSIVLGYNYYMGTRNKWKPKINYNSCVYHKTMAQRMILKDLHEETMKNLNGLYAQYGAYGFDELKRIHNSELFEQLYNNCTVFDIFKLG